MNSTAPGREQWQWVVQPLAEAGLGSEEIRTLVTRLSCEAVLAGHDLDQEVRGMVRDRPARVRAAWTETIHRMLSAPGPAC